MFGLKSLFGNEKAESNVVTRNYTLEKVNLKCHSCDKVNVVETINLSLNPVCNTCKTSLEIIEAPVKVTTETFEKEVLSYSGIVLVDFWATWCPPCKMIAPILENIAKEKAGEIKIVKVDVDQEPELSAKHFITSIPTLMVFQNGVKLNQVSGAMPKTALLNWIYSSIKK